MVLALDEDPGSSIPKEVVPRTKRSMNAIAYPCGPDKLSEDETNKLIAVLEKHRSVLGYTLQDLKGINPALCTH